MLTSQHFLQAFNIDFAYKGNVLLKPVKGRESKDSLHRLSFDLSWVALQRLETKQTCDFEIKIVQ